MIATGPDDPNSTAATATSLQVRGTTGPRAARPAPNPG
jgi:hypothetical protein